MPPEVMIANPKYDTSVDEFSYGIMMIHMFSGRWPEPQVGPIRAEPGGRMIPVSEAERREVFLRAIGNDHPLMDLIHKCIDNYVQSRAHASEIVERLAQMVLQFPASFVSRLEMLKQIEADGEEKRALTEEGKRKDRVIQQKENEISLHREEAQAEKDKNSAKIHRLKLAHSSEVEQLRLQVRDLNTKSQLTKVENKAEITTLQDTNSRLQSDITEKDTTIQINYSQLEAMSRALEEKDATIAAMNEQLTKTREYLTTKQQVSIYTTSDYSQWMYMSYNSQFN